MSFRRSPPRLSFTTIVQVAIAAGLFALVQSLLFLGAPTELVWLTVIATGSQARSLTR